MGYNTPVLILNDALHHLEDDTTLGKRIVQAVGEANFHNPVVVSSGGHMNALTVYPSKHADVVQIYAFGGNHATRLGMFHNGGHHYTPEEQVQLLKDLANQYGFNLVRKRGAKT